MRLVVATPSPQTNLPNQDRNLQKRWVSLPWSNFMTDKRSVNRVEKWALTVRRVMVWDSLRSARYIRCLVIDATWIIPYSIPTSSKQPTWYKDRPRYKRTLTLQTSLLSFSLALDLCSLTGASHGLQCSRPCSLFLFSLSFSIKNKYNYLIMESPLIKKQSSVILLEVPECWMVRNSRLSTFFLSLLLFICKSSYPPIYLLLQVFRQGLKPCQPQTAACHPAPAWDLK